MIINFKIFEAKTHQTLSDISPEFWKMTKIVNWPKLIGPHHISTAKMKLIKHYSLNRILKFKSEYDKLYDRLYNYFKDAWLNDMDVSDDGYSDLLSSIIGAGKTFVEKCLMDDDMVISFSKSHKVKENFGYIFQTDDYDSILKEIDPIRWESEKFGL